MSTQIKVTEMLLSPSHVQNQDSEGKLLSFSEMKTSQKENVKQKKETTKGLMATNKLRQSRQKDRGKVIFKANHILIFGKWYPKVNT